MPLLPLELPVYHVVGTVPGVEVLPYLFVDVDVVKVQFKTGFKLSLFAAGGSCILIKQQLLVHDYPWFAIQYIHVVVISHRSHLVLQDVLFEHARGWTDITGDIDAWSLLLA